MTKSTKAKIKEPKLNQVEGQCVVEASILAEQSKLDADGAPQPREPDRSKIERMDANSLKARFEMEKWSVIRELWRSHVQMVTFYMTPSGGTLSLEEAIKIASHELGEGALEEEIDRLRGWDVDSISWYSLDRVFRSNPSYAQQLWEDMKDAALRDFKSGHFAADLFERTDWQKDAWKRAHFVTVFQEMLEEYKPRGAIELSMVEVVAVNYFLWRHWTMEHLQRATSEPRRESWDYQEWRKDRKRFHTRNGVRREEEYSGQYIDGHWDVPYQIEADAIVQAAEIADRFRRAYHASLRALRDWRRYAIPLTINNPQQVNIASDGAQQVNVSESQCLTSESEC